MSVVILTDGIGDAQQCMIRATVRKYLSQGSVVRTMDVQETLDSSITGKLHLLVHVSRITMARLLLPKLLPPCVRKTIWIDLDALVLAPLDSLFAVDQTAADSTGTRSCGIAGRESIVSNYLAGSYVGPDRDARLSSLRSVVTFNAGVSVMDLEFLRGSPEYEQTVTKYAFTQGNDDQVTLNLWCDGRYVKVDPKWNVFNNMVDKDPMLGESLESWGVAHFAGHPKPWDDKKPYFANEKMKRAWKKHAVNIWG